MVLKTLTCLGLNFVNSLHWLIIPMAQDYKYISIFFSQYCVQKYLVCISPNKVTVHSVIWNILTSNTKSISNLSEICNIPNKSDQICFDVKKVRKYVLCSLVACSWHRPQFIHGLLSTQALENKNLLGQLIIE